MKKVGFKKMESVLFNLDSAYNALMYEADVARESGDESSYYEKRQEADEVASLYFRAKRGLASAQEWARIDEVVEARKMQRYAACIAEGVDEATASGAFED